ncbi:MAG: hypothetical protein ACPGSK_04770, partial [Alphaproteobacteria bacterium]
MMSMTLLGIIGLVSLFSLLALRMPVALSMLGVGFVGTVVVNANKFLQKTIFLNRSWPSITGRRSI